VSIRRVAINRWIGLTTQKFMVETIYRLPIFQELLRRRTARSGGEELGLELSTSAPFNAHERVFDLSFFLFLRGDAHRKHACYLVKRFLVFSQRLIFLVVLKAKAKCHSSEWLSFIYKVVLLQILNRTILVFPSEEFNDQNRCKQNSC
jgi:hypothetical protein